MKKGVRLFCEEVDTLLNLYRDFHRVQQLSLTYIMILSNFSFFKFLVKMFIHCLVIYLHYLCSLPVRAKVKIISNLMIFAFPAIYTILNYFQESINEGFHCH